jgi:hypothetical protein
MRFTLFASTSGAARAARSLRSFVVAAGMLGTAAACGDDGNFLSPASSANVIRTYNVWALSGTSNALPAAVQLSALTAERPQLLANGSVILEIDLDLIE